MVKSAMKIETWPEGSNSPSKCRSFFDLTKVMIGTDLSDLTVGFMCKNLIG